MTVANGLFIGTLAAALGTAAGLLAWLAAVPLLEVTAGFRINVLNIPWWLVAMGMLLALVTATGAAWWPARTIARIPIVLALSGRPPTPKAARRSAVQAAAAMAAGSICLVVSGQANGLLVTTGTLLTVLGVLLAGPPALRLIGVAAGSFPITVRLPLRDLARYQRRSSAALAAISLALGIAAAIVIITASAEHGADKGNLSDRQLLIRTGTAVGGRGSVSSSPGRAPGCPV